MNTPSVNGHHTVLVHIDFHSPGNNENLDEFIELARSSGLMDLSLITGQRDRPDSSLFVGSGKVDEIAQSVLLNHAELVIFNHVLSPAQERNLERQLKCRVINRISLILDIFAQRARSYEGKLQVELAQLQYLSTRLVRGWTHLERQKGGIGLRGPGETQLETDRRLIKKRIKTLNFRLDKVRQQREQGRRQRKKTAIPVISLVGYTNSGKSTLFNRITGASVYTANKLFATLDPTLRRVELKSGRSYIISDTVGFIRHIPHNLIDAFHATLQETHEADLLLHIIDVDEENRQSRIEQVNQVIKDIGAESIPQIEVYNKIDLHEMINARTEISQTGPCHRVWVSAKSGAGVEQLLELVGKVLGPKLRTQRLCLPPSAGGLRARLFHLGAVRNEQERECGGWIIEVELDNVSLHHLCLESNLDVGLLQNSVIPH
ncbi:MAG: GTPase HflX [Gammaproteobacteria bacterium RBG_16_51_14]|nr:MAG: GTPase HflX [Gammaproteobacteria bacterium RBG_16_51_14]